MAFVFLFVKRIQRVIVNYIFEERKIAIFIINLKIYGSRSR